jgi:hypothetical protein
MKKVPLVWTQLREWNGSLPTAFERICNHFAAYESVPPGSTFIPNAPPDGGVESYWVFPGCAEWGFQAKFFVSKPDSGEWGQIDKSVRRAIETHPKLSRYTICLPIDRADPRKEGKEYFKDAWDDHERKWNGWAQEKGLKLSFDYWGETELSERFAQEKHAGRYYFWFHSELFSDAWFAKQLSRTKENAGARYTSDLNVELPIRHVFDGLFRRPEFFQTLGNLHKEIKKRSRFGVSEPDAFAKAEVEALNLAARSISSELGRAIHATSEQQINLQALIDLAGEGRQAAENYRDVLRNFEKKKRQEIIDTQGESELLNRDTVQSMFSDQQARSIHFVNSLYELSSFCESSDGKAANAPALLTLGNGGCGKTHLLCDIAFRQLKDGCPAVLLLGQHFNMANPWTQVLDQLGLGCKFEEFLSALELAGQLRGTFAMLAIDALNEGDGKQLWHKHLAGFLADLRQFPGIRVALSVRSTYEDVCIPKHITEQHLLKIFHPGFADLEYKATETFFAHYKIKRPSIPLLVPEFQSPLFLKMFCQALQNKGMTDIPPGFHGINSVFNFFIESVHDKLSGPDYLDCDPHSRVVFKAIDALADMMAEQGRTYIPREAATAAVNLIVPYSGFHKSLMHHLISEGVLSEDRRPGEAPSREFIDVVHFSYERFTDHLIGKRLLDKHLDEYDPESAFDNGAPLQKLFGGGFAARRNRGLLEAFCVQVPERINREFPDIAGAEKESGAMRSAFLDSLAMRDTATFSSQTFDYINDVILKYKGGWEGLLDVLLSVAAIPDHPLNARILHAKLLSIPMPQRDSHWTIYLCNRHGQQGSVDRLMEWAASPDDKSYLDSKSRVLCGLVLGWYLTSSNRRQRDLATKGLVRLFSDHLPLMVEVMQSFEDVDDPYVSERLYCAAYGCALRGRKSQALRALAAYVYRVVFEGKRPRANILLRDYARGIIEYALHRKIALNIKERRVRPLYKSVWKDEIPTMEALRQQYGYKKDIGGTDGKDWHSIYGSVMGSGDFERYVIGTNSGYFEWSSRRIGEPKITLQERRDEPPFDLRIAQRWIFNRVVELGWTPALFAEFDRQINSWSWDRRSDKAERIGKKYQWIAFYEFLARVSDNFQYIGDRWDARDAKFTGPWQVAYVRNIDPSCLLTNDDGDSKASAWWSPIKYFPPSKAPETDWLKTTGDLPDPAPMLKVQRPSDGSKWLVLETHRSFEDPTPLGEERFDRPFKQIWYMVRSYLVHKADASKLIGSLASESFWGRWMPESTDEYKILQGEYFWSPAYAANDTPYRGHDAWTRGDAGRRLAKKVCVTAEEFLKERVYDCSIEESIHLLFPSKTLANGMSLEWSGCDGAFCDLSGKDIAFDPAAKEAGPHALLVRQDEFHEFLSENDLSFFWTILGAKQGMNSGMSHDDWNGELRINGLYQLVEGEVLGTLRTEFINRDNYS